MKKLIEIIERELKIPNLTGILKYINSIPVNEIINYQQLIDFSKLSADTILSLLSILKREKYLTIKYKLDDTYYNSLEDLVNCFPDYDLNTVQIYFKKTKTIVNDSYKILHAENMEQLEELLKKIDWFYPNKNEYPEPGKLFVTSNSVPCQMYVDTKYKDLLSNSLHDIKNVEAWTYLPRYN